ncbi:hypothetical protein ABE67_12070 [Cytobacillus firmus]|uniref:hypothetical protein n=1 Tax=Cytobacillus firmus TaxID=1399 RepID=UPI0018CD2771|nr:hypothetical protein [Cytobacillus firmus]MBG9450047.1 hypothetical protein [Cytobacillus firmus]
MKLYNVPLKGFLVNDLVAYDSDVNDNQVVYQIRKGEVLVIGEFSSTKYDSGIALIIHANDEVISVD